MQCTVRHLFFFFLTKSQPFNKKQPTDTINQIKQSEKTIPATIQSITPKKQNITNTKNYLTNQSQNQSQKTTTNNPHNLSIKTPKDKHNKQLRKNATFLNIKISQTATTSEPTTNTPFIKTQYNRKRQNNTLHFEVTILQTQKSNTLYF